MKLHSLRIKHYRCVQDQTIQFDGYNCLVGPNGSGKSTVLMALNVFFRNTEAPTDVVTLTEEDFYNRDTSQPIEITATFRHLGEEAKADLKAYVRQDELVVLSRAIWHPASNSAEVRQLGSRSVMKAFTEYFEANEAGAKAADLKAIFSRIRENHPDVEAATTKDAMLASLRSFEEAHPELCEPVESASQFYGWSRGVNLLGRHVQWIYLPAVKDPASEQDEQRNSALGKLLQRSVRSQIDFSEPINELRREACESYQQVLAEQNKVLADIGQSIENSLRLWAHPGTRVQLSWHFDDKKSVTVTDPYARAAVGEGAFLGEIARAGHGVQRSFLVALLQVLADMDNDASPTLILGFEEPELYQHPPQAKHLASVLEELSEQRAQIVVTTHSPYFVSSRGYESIRMFRIPSGQPACSVSTVSYKLLAKRLATALGETPSTRSSLIATVEQIMQPSQNEMFFCKLPILVEGAEDIAFIATWLQHFDHWPTFRRLGCHFVSCEGKTNISRPLAIASLLGLSPFVVFDGDCDKANGQDEEMHRRDNRCLLALLEEECEPLVEDCYFGRRAVMWRTRILDEIRAEVSPDVWDTAENHARQEQDLQQGVKRKNPMLVAATVERLLLDGVQISRLDRLGGALLKHAESECG